MVVFTHNEPKISYNFHSTTNCEYIEVTTCRLNWPLNTTLDILISVLEVKHFGARQKYHWPRQFIQEVILFVCSLVICSAEAGFSLRKNFNVRQLTRVILMTDDYRNNRHMIMKHDEMDFSPKCHSLTQNQADKIPICFSFTSFFYKMTWDPSLWKGVVVFFSVP